MDQAMLDLIEMINFTESVAVKIHGLLDEAEICRTVTAALPNCGRTLRS